MDRLVVIAVALLVAPALAGCISGEEGPSELDLAGNSTGENDSSTALPDGRDFAAAKETNRTEAGLGGKLHTHDYWRSDTKVTVFDDRLASPATPVFPSREDTSAVFVRFASLTTVPGDDERPALVFEGTGLVEFTLVSAPKWADSYTLSFRTAGADWSAPIPIKPGETHQYEPTKLETDMPHSTRSLWNWRIVAEGPVPVTGLTGTTQATRDATNHETEVRATIVVHKARDVDDWPGHPAFYDGLSRRVVLDGKPGKTNVQHAADVLVFGLEPDQLVPDKLISMGTDTLDIWANITRIDSPVFPPTGFTLNWRSAATAPFEIGVHQNANATDEKTTAYWHIKVDPDMLDAPYQPGSRWSFKVLMNTGNEEVLRTYCYRCLPYNLEYTLTVVARPNPDAVPVALEE